MNRLIIETAHAHVKYVLDEHAPVQPQPGTDWTFLLEPLKDPVNIALMVGTLIVVAVIILIVNKVAFLHRRAEYIRHQAKSYQNIISWIMRLSLGIALIGAGSSGFLISPALTVTSATLSTTQIAIGFLLMIGFFLAPALWATVIVFFVGLFQDSYLVGNLELLAAAIALLILANPWPGLDHLVGIPFPGPPKRWHHAVPLILRLGLGIAMLYLAIYEKILNPNLSATVVTEYGLDQDIPVSPAMWVLSAGIIEAALGLLIISGLYTRIVTAITFVVLSMSFFYFNEAVYSHITLFGVLSVLFAIGSGREASPETKS